ncbi:CD99 molecule isoform X3 [Polypterus senegalus]|uniref:CD99 molecule isoform X3 n=1 Tax=Polypterus senegalus TaxID=55291 RepID=UPI001964A4ED|nr:CD99 molecule isoform X3 [Polypterus senegalus]
MLTLRIVFFFCLVLTVSGQGFDLSDAFDEPPKTTPKPPVKIPDAPPKNPSSDFDLEDAFGGGIDPKPTVKPPVKNPGSSGGNFGDSDLNDVVGEDGYQPDKGKGGPRVGPAQDDEQQYEEGGAQDLEHWRGILKLLIANMPENLLIWIQNLQQVAEPLIERLLEMLNVVNLN